MKKSVFIDSDVFLDVALDRSPFVNSSELILDHVFLKKANAFTSPLIIANLYYIVSKNATSFKAKQFIKIIESKIEILPIDKVIVHRALNSEIKDFEDALQYFCAAEGGVDYIITRNKKDYPESKIHVVSPVEFLENHA